MMTKTIIKPAGVAPAVGPYNLGVRAGDLLFCAGQIPIVPETGQVQSGDIQAQTERVLENIRLILKDQGLTPAHVVKATVFMVDLAQFADMNAAYGRFFGSDFPARTTVQVAALPRGAAIEIEVIAHY
jgi:2-iminobutanoate/2-iminopropanoate deaminase